MLQSALEEPWPTNAEMFEERRQVAKGKLNLVAQEIARLVTELVQSCVLITKKLKNCPDKAVVEDIRHQLEGLFFKHFLLTIGYAHLVHYPRYLNAILQRLDKWQDDRIKDAEKMRDVGRFVTMYERELSSRKGVTDARLQDFRWLIEELRVSLFAQKLRTPMPVSVKRLDKVWAAMRY